MQNPKDLFERWYVCPLKALESIPNGDGGFIALATSCFLYERYATTMIKNSPGIHRKATKDAKISQFAEDFDVDEQTAKYFWEMIRDGLLHGAMPKQREHGKRTLPTWAFRGDFPKPVELSEYIGQPVLKVQPWLFMNKVIALWRENLDLLEASDSFPWGNIFTLPF